MEYDSINIIQFAKDFEANATTKEIRTANYYLHTLLVSCMKRGTKERENKIAELDKVFAYQLEPKGEPPAFHNYLGAMTHGGLAWNAVCAVMKYANIPEATAKALVIKEYERKA